jgi:hypothetical protein
VPSTLPIFEASSSQAMQGGIFARALVDRTLRRGHALFAASSWHEGYGRWLLGMRKLIGSICMVIGSVFRTGIVIETITAGIVSRSVDKSTKIKNYHGIGTCCTCTKSDSRYGRNMKVSLYVLELMKQILLSKSSCVQNAR